jgi:hypothetical protein
MTEIEGINRKTSTEYIEEIYEFKGQWDVPSKCGLLIRKHPHMHIVIATELYDDNPGTSVNYWNAQIAEAVCKARDLDPSKLVFIEHAPDRGSRLEIYQETFDRVIFQHADDGSTDPDWQSLTRAQVDGLLKGESTLPDGDTEGR